MKMKLIKRQLFFAVFFLFTNWATAQDYGNFPYFQPFNSGVKPSDVTIPSNSDAVTFTSNGMILTPSQNTRFGAAYLNNIRFYSPQGIRLEFEYGMYGGTGADGLSVFLFDAAVTNPQIGARGDALAYNYNRANNIHSTTRQAGLTGAYLGIGLDAFGNFKNRVFQGERRKNGFGGTLTVANSHVSLRGAAGKTSLGNDGRGIGFNGYPLLATKSTRSGASAGAILNNDGSFTTTAGTAANFNLATTTLGLTPNDANFRKAYIDLFPNASGGYNVTVKIQHGTTITTIIDNFHYKTSLNYVENANPQTTDFSNNEASGPNSTHVLDASIPEYFRIGFGASTGGFNNVHLIKNLKIMIPYAAEANDDTFNLTCTTNSINVLTNDLAYTNFAAPTASTNNIYKPSFRFLNASGVPQGHTYTDPAVGTWTYNQLTGVVSLSPVAGFSGTAKVQYDIKGGGSTGTETPFDKDAYRSGPATITANVTALATAPGVVSTLSNNCLNASSTVNLNDAFIGTVPSNLVWFNNDLHTGTALTASEIANAGAGTYYAFYYNSVTACYSAASVPVVVSVYPCIGCGVVQRASFPNSSGVLSSSAYLNANTIGIGTSRITVVNTVTGNAVIGSAPDYNGISNGHYQSEPGIRIGKEQADGIGAINASNAIKTTVNFSKPVNDLSFRLHDLDWGDNVTVNAYNQAGALVTLGASNYFIHNTANITKTGNRFHEVTPPQNETLNNTRGGTVDISYPGMTISRVEFIFYDTKDAGNYTIAEFKGIIPCEPFCYKPGATGGDILPTTHGITALGRASEDTGGWPMIRNGAWTALEAKTKGFVINRIATTALVNAIADPKEGMMVYDEEADCLKINTTGTSAGWKCFNVQTCPDGTTN